MSAAQYDFEVEQGTTFSKSVQWKDANGNTINLNGYTARMQLRRSKTSPTILVEATTENGKLVVNGPGGAVTITFSAADTAQWSFSRAVYDLELISAGGIVTRLLEGSFTVSKEVTR